MVIRLKMEKGELICSPRTKGIKSLLLIYALELSL
jgi:hypothetical protein